MPIDMNEARSLVEDAKKRGLILAPGAVPVRPEVKQKDAGPSVLPDWLQEAIVTPSPCE